MSYDPRPGTVAYRALAFLDQRQLQEFTASQIAERLGGVDASKVVSSLSGALAAGLVYRRQRDHSSPRAPFFYSKTDQGATDRAKRPNPVGWLLQESAKFTRPPNSRSQESVAQPDPNATGNGNMAHNTEHAAPLGGQAEGEGATAPSPGMRDAKPAEGTTEATPSRGHPLMDARSKAMRATVAALPIAPTKITRKNAESGSKPGTPGAPDGVVTSSAPRAADDAPSGEGPAAADAPGARAAEPDWPAIAARDLPNGDRLLPGDYLVHKRSGFELVYGRGEMQPSSISAPHDDARFALFCDGELMVSCGGTVIQLKAEHVQRLRKLLGGGA